MINPADFECISDRFWLPCVSKSTIGAGLPRRLLQAMRRVADMLMNSRDVFNFVLFQNFGKCPWFRMICHPAFARSRNTARAKRVAPNELHELLPDTPSKTTGVRLRASILSPGRAGTSAYSASMESIA